MIRINPLHINQTDRTTKKKKTSSASGSAFSGYLGEAEAADEVTDVTAVQDTSALSHTNPMLSLQEMPDMEVARRQEVKRGRQTIQVLEDLQRALLMGAVPPSTLQQLERFVSEQRQGSNDPRLQAILDDIELRAAVELAKLEMAHERSR